MRKGTRTVTVTGLNVQHRALPRGATVMNARLVQSLGLGPDDSARVRVRPARDGDWRITPSALDRAYWLVLRRGHSVGYVCKRNLARVLGCRPRPGMRFDVTVLS